MIPKANQRAGGQQLATHLLNEFDNDRVELAEVRGAFARDLHGAFAEWEVASNATQCKKFLYSLSINPDPDQRPVTRDEYYDYIRRTEAALRLSEQPRAVVFHVKYGREHCHVVWSRIDDLKGRAVQMSHDRQKLRTVTQEFARDHGLELPAGMRQNNLRDRFNNRKRLENLAEKQQEERTGISKAERMATITAAWRESDSGESFTAALEKRGYFLARGDQRAYVVVDLYGEIHSLTRQIQGAKTKDVKARLAGYDVDKLPDATKAQDFARRKLDGQRAASPGRAATAKTKRAELATAQTKRRAAIDDRRRALFEKHRIERAALAAAQESATKGIHSARLRAQPRGVIAFLARITGVSFVIAQRQKRQDRARVEDHDRQTQALKRRHEREVKEFQHNYRALTSLDKRERRSLETGLRREEFRAIARPRSPQVRRPPPQQLTSRQREKLEQFLTNARDITATQGTPAVDAGDLARKFNEAAEQMKEDHEHDDLLRAFRDAVAGVTGGTPSPAAEPEAPPDSLRETFRERAAQKKREGEREKRQPQQRGPGPARDRNR